MLAVILLARPITVMVSLIGSDVPMNERLLIALTGPRGVVLVAVAGLFAERLVGLGYEDAAKIPALAFALVAATVVLHGLYSCAARELARPHGGSRLWRSDRWRL